MGDCDQPSAAVRFNNSLHTARIEEQGCRLIEGAAYLDSSRRGGVDGSHYRLNIIGSTKLWAETLGRMPFRELGAGLQFTLSAESIIASWTAANSPIRMLPVERLAYRSNGASVGLSHVNRALSESDYHPFLHIKSCLDLMFAKAGYRIESDFFESDFFNSLYMSGRYRSRDVSALREEMDFLSGRFDQATATADSFGRVYADPLRTSNTVGNIVESADPNMVQNGASIDGAYTRGGCFVVDNNRAAFIPTREVTVGFEYRLHYLTPYTILQRNELSGFNRINLGGEDMRSFKIVNRFVDRRQQFTANRTYTAVVFDHTDTCQYRLTSECITNPTADRENLTSSDCTTVTVAEWQAAWASVAIISDKTVFGPTLLCRHSSTQPWTPYSGDWALYDGYIEYQGVCEVDITLRSAPERITPATGKYFDRIYFAGAAEGAQFTLLSSTTVCPIFLPQPTLGQTFTWADIAAYDFSCKELVDAMRHMFNLRFYTDNIGKRVIILPHDMFFNDTVVDWSDRIDLDREIAIEECGSDSASELLFRYGDATGAVAEWNTANDDTLGAWSARVDSCAARAGTRGYVNPIFRPAVNVTGTIPACSDASLLHVGSGEGENRYADDFNFAPVVVRYMGMRSLPDTQTWDWPSYTGAYPFAAFFHAGDRLRSQSGAQSLTLNYSSAEELILNGFSLCFESRDDIDGLGRLREEEIALINRSRRIKLYVRLHPEEVEALATPNDLARDLRAAYRLRIGGESGLYRLEEVSDYNPCAASTKCSFIKID